MQSLGAMIATIGLPLQFFNKVIELDLKLGILIINECQPDMAIQIYEIRCYLEIRPYIQSFRIGLISVESLSPFLFRFNFDGG